MKSRPTWRTISDAQLEALRHRALVEHDYDLAAVACDALGLDRAYGAMSKRETEYAKKLCAGVIRKEVAPTEVG